MAHVNEGTPIHSRLLRMSGVCRDAASLSPRDEFTIAPSPGKLCSCGAMGFYGVGNHSRELIDSSLGLYVPVRTLSTKRRHAILGTRRRWSAGIAWSIISFASFCVSLEALDT